MRRPRGPGGRFLTAEEIAAQKLAQQPTQEEHTPAVLIDSPDPPLDQEHALDQPQSPIPTPAGLAATPYSNASPPPLPPTFPDNRPPAAAHIASPATTQSSPVQANAQTSPILPAQPHLSHHPGKPAANASVALRPPYSPAQMHHVPHPHAHTRLRHSHLNFTDGLYQAEEPSGADNTMMAYGSQTPT